MSIWRSELAVVTTSATAVVRVELLGLVLSEAWVVSGVSLVLKHRAHRILISLRHGSLPLHSRLPRCGTSIQICETDLILECLSVWSMKLGCGHGPMRTDLIKELVLGSGRLKDRTLAVWTVSIAWPIAALAALTTCWWDLVAHRVGSAKISPIVMMLSRIIILFLETFHINFRSEFQWRHAAYAIIWLI